MPVVTLPGAPDLLALHVADAQRYPFLLQTRGADDGWDILFAFPETALFHRAQSTPSFFSALDAAWRDAGADTQDAEALSLPFRGGWFLYAGYELLHELEPHVPPRPPEEAFPLGVLTRIPAAVMVNRARQQTFLFAEAACAGRLATLRADLENAAPFSGGAVRTTHLREEDEALFLDGVSRIQHYIHEGDVFQVNLARRWQGELADGSAADVYAALRRTNPAPFAGIADFGQQQIVSSSPERLLRVQDGKIETRPIAGTHPRSPDPDEDEKLRAALMSSPKERAEHIMLIDLERNDLGRICQPGSVAVDALMEVRSYAHVHHIESSVRGRLRDGATPGEILGALFPGGTITGCPKVRTMQIIRELEASARLAYTGSMGYLNRDGSMDMNILIRSFMLDGKQFSFKAGAGIVADSEPTRELAETRAKAKGLLKALET